MHHGQKSCKALWVEQGLQSLMSRLCHSIIFVIQLKFVSLWVICSCAQKVKFIICKLERKVYLRTKEAMCRNVPITWWEFSNYCYDLCYPFCIMRGHHWEHFKCTILSKGCVHMAVRVQEVRTRGVYKRCVHMAVWLSAPSVSTTFHLPNRTRYPWRADSLLTPAPCEPHLIFYLWEFDCSRCLI